jgi:hypothetical protein
MVNGIHVRLRHHAELLAMAAITTFLLARL